MTEASAEVEAPEASGAKSEELTFDAVKTKFKTELDDLVNHAVTSRLERVKGEAIKNAAEEIANESLTKVKDLEAQVLKFQTDNLILKLSSELGVDKDLLEESGLTGDKLNNFAKKIAEAKKSWVSTDASKAVDNAAKKTAAGNKSGKSVKQLTNEKIAAKKGEKK